MGPDGELPTLYGNLSLLPPGVVAKNEAGNVPTGDLFLLGSNRLNQQPQAMCFNILWRREHNRQARLLSSRNPSWNDEIVYQEARRRVIALMQHFFETECIFFQGGKLIRLDIPILLGATGLDAYAGYQELADPSVNLLFNTVALRYGHSQVSNVTLRLEEDRSNSTGGNIVLRVY